MASAKMNPYLQFPPDMPDGSEGFIAPPYQVTRGRRIYLGHAIATLAFATALFVVNIVFFAPTQPFRIAFNLAVIAACTFFANRGSITAKWVIMILLSFGGIRVIQHVWENHQDMRWFYNTVFAATGCIYYSFAMVLGWSPSVRTYLEFQRQRYKSRGQ